MFKMNLIKQKSQFSNGKKIMRKTLGSYLTPRVSEYIKQGFSAPDASWFKGESIDYVKTILFDPKLNLCRILNAEKLEGIIQEHFEGRKNHRLLIWSFLNLENAFKRFFG